MSNSAIPWTAVHQASLSITNFQSLLKLMSIETLMPSNHLILCHPLLLPPSIIPSTRVFSNESVLHIRWPKYWSFSFSISPSNEYSGLISSRKYFVYVLSWSFMTLCFIFASFIYFEFIFVCGVRECSNFIDLCSCPAGPMLHAGKTVFSIVNSHFLCQRLINPKAVGVWVYSGALLCSIDLCLFWCQYYVILITVAL